jgi:hypothetical protein
MKILTLLVLAVLIYSSYSFILFQLVGPLSSQGFTCLTTSYPEAAPYAIVRVYRHSQNPPGIDQNSVQTLINCYNGKVGCGIYLEACPGGDPTSQINLINSEVIIPLYNQGY